MDNTATLDTPVDVLDTHAATCDAVLGSFSGTGTHSALASVSVTSRRFASSVTNRVGASPSARRVACRTVNKTCIH